MADLTTNAAVNQIAQALTNVNPNYNTNAALNLISTVIAGAGGGSITTGNLKFITAKSDFPAPIAGVITLQSNYSYFLCGDIDLTGDRLVTSGDTTIMGASSETSSLTSTGLSVSSPLITANSTLALLHFTILNVGTGVLVGGSSTYAYDWTAVNFLNVTTIGEVNTCGNFVYDKGAFLSSQGLVFKGTVGTIAINNSLFINTSGTIITTDAALVITRRFRITYSSLVVAATTTGINFNVLTTVPTEGYILDTVNFSNIGTYLSGVDYTSNKSLFVECKGITNTSVNGQLYAQSNVTPTPIAVINTFYKVLGTTTASADNSKYSHSNNRLTCDAVVERTYLIMCTLAFESGNNNICRFGFYDSKIAAVRTPSKISSTANAAGRAESVSFMCVVKHSLGDYLEIHCANSTGTNAITVTDLNFTITEIN